MGHVLARAKDQNSLIKRISVGLQYKLQPKKGQHRCSTKSCQHRCSNLGRKDPLDHHCWSCPHAGQCAQTEDCLPCGNVINVKSQGPCGPLTPLNRERKGQHRCPTKSCQPRRSNPGRKDPLDHHAWSRPHAGQCALQIY